MNVNKENPNKENPNKEKQVQNVDDKVLDDRASSFSSDCVVVQKSVQANFEANFGRMSVDVLRFLCHELGIAESGSKQDLVNRLVSESKRREVSGDTFAEKNKAFAGGEGASAPMFGSVGSSLFEPVAGSTSSTGDVRPGEKRFVSNTLGNDQYQQTAWFLNKTLGSCERPRVAQEQSFARYEPQDKQVQTSFFQGVQPLLPTLVQPQPFVQPLWHQAPFQAMGSGPQVSQDSFSRNLAHSPQIQLSYGKVQQSASNSGANGRIGLRGLPDPTRNSAVQFLVNSVKKWVARDAETVWPRYPLSVEAIKHYFLFPPEENMDK
ncbi:20178_t:CDS:2 [Cetraspora pellucida]|uniref:20178_t:CDS:1 n=1 Tax=Cetraspora pellucida TaxID=1433469 RepID=A0A9N9CC58_9GLOM|nr:20178_t:CDS:2 [Cetraspora pellucida]